MKIKLLTRQKIWHNAGEIVEVSPDVADFLLSVGAGEMIKDAPKKSPTKKGTTNNDKNN